MVVRLGIGLAGVAWASGRRQRLLSCPWTSVRSHLVRLSCLVRTDPLVLLKPELACMHCEETNAMTQHVVGLARSILNMIAEEMAGTA